MPLRFGPRSLRYFVDFFIGCDEITYEGGRKVCAPSGDLKVRTELMRPVDPRSITVQLAKRPPECL
jgi:hypothetical protein